MSTVRAAATSEHRTTVRSLAARKRRGERFAMLTAYDFAFARIFDAAGIDVLLVGDSLGNVVQGRDTTLPVTLDEVIYHTRMVSSRRERAPWSWPTCPSAPTRCASEDARAQRAMRLREGRRCPRREARGRVGRRARRSQRIVRS